MSATIRQIPDELPLAAPLPERPLVQHPRPGVARRRRAHLAGAGRRGDALAARPGLARAHARSTRARQDASRSNTVALDDALCVASDGWFTVGFDTADIQEARVLLEELGG